MVEPGKIFTGLSLGARIRSRELLAFHRPESAGQHCVQFYEQDSFLVEYISYLAANALETGSSSVLIATASHLSAIEKRLAPVGLDQFRDAGRYVALDAAETLQLLMTDGWPDATKFTPLIGSVIRSATEASASGFAFAFGEMVAILSMAGKYDAAVALEKLWNWIAGQYSFSLCCCYPLATFDNARGWDALAKICSEHSLAVPAETLF
jgi:MEDS: MEthanogen/methylotroph, DcmR Sensory domain